ncbi:MAG: HAMP domain-containing sensor histidine kinase [Rhodocyclales bacterium]|nr:HAMP domain-containing sensor histidine kinase [Rhodocyclales bacterium]
MNLYPRSFLRLIVLGNVLALLPLLAAIGYASLTVDDLTRRSEVTVRQASRAATLSYALHEDLNHMERILRQYEALRNPSLLDEYLTERQEWRKSAQEYAGITLLANLSVRIRDIQQREANAYEKLGARGERLPQLKATLATIKGDLQRLLGDASQLVEAEREAFRIEAENLRERLMAAILAALALTGLLVWFGRRMVAQLWSRFERVVLALGEGRLDRRIRLKGPEDMQLVGNRLEWLRKRILALEKDRTRIMRHASHELKTPLATLREGANLLAEGVAGPLTPQQEKIAGIMQVNAMRLQGLIDGVLRMQQASHARDQMETSAIRLDKLVEQTLATLKLAARNRQVRITGSLVPLTIEGGAEALATLADNLISNAIKFSPDGGVVRITLTREGENAVLDVMDDGPGISAEDGERIFEPFYRGAAGKGVSGVGLGLAIAHEFALAHHGTLGIVESAKGAHFRASLPLGSRQQETPVLPVGERRRSADGRP